MSPTADLVVTSDRIITPEGERPGAVVVSDGSITAVVPREAAPAARNAFDAGSAAVLPGIVDTHVHLNEPGRTDWEGFATGTRAAAAGGVTTVVDMPLNSVPVTTNVAALRQKAAAAHGVALVDYGFWGGVVPGNAADLAPLLDAGAVGFKVFLVPSGIDEFPMTGSADLTEAMTRIAEHNAVLLVHAEAPEVIEQATRDTSGDPRSYATWLASRPVAAEIAAIDRMLELSERTGCRVHIVHLACVDGIARLAAARRSGVRVTAETCPHYLSFAAEDVADGATAFKCAPPIRERAHRDGLWHGLEHGDIDLVASDHSPSPPALKCLDSGKLHGRLGRHRLARDRPCRCLDRRAGARAIVGGRGSLDVPPPRAPRRSHTQGAYRAGMRRRSRDLRSGPPLDGGPADPAPTAPGHPVRGSGAPGPGVANICARYVRLRR